MLSTPTKADVKSPTQADLVRLTGLEVLARLPVEIMRAERRAGRNTAGVISGYEGASLCGYHVEVTHHHALPAGAQRRACRDGRSGEPGRVGVTGMHGGRRPRVLVRQTGRIGPGVGCVP